MKLRERHLGPIAALLLAIAAPFASDAANNATCCNVATTYMADIFRGGYGDEDFFSLPGGSPNVMLVLDNSSSMLDFPVPLPFPSSWPASNGTCSVAALDVYSALQTSIPYDNGYTTTVGGSPLVDDPPWGLARCTAANKCLFKGTSYYRRGTSSIPDGWTTDGATEYTLASACSGTTNAAECQTCLDTKGYYLFRSGGNNAAFKGTFLNAYPPKFVVARKVVKDLVAMDDSRSSPLDSVRFGLTIFNPNALSYSSVGSSLNANDGGQLVVPLGPRCMYPVYGSDMLEPRQAILTAVNNPTLVPFKTSGGFIGTPLAETLYNVGQYFTEGGNGSLYWTLFGSGWTNSSFAETSSGTFNAPWGGTGGGASQPKQHSICWSCQQSSIVIVTDGEPTVDNNLPRSGVSADHPTVGTAGNGDLRRWTNGIIACPTCGNDGINGSANLLHKVAAFLHGTDLRADYTGSQTVNVYTISFGIDAATSPEAVALLDKTAELGGGKFTNTADGDTLSNALYNAITDVISRATSFSQANTSTLQTGTRTQLFLTRFKASDSPMWEGHVYRFLLFWEFAQGCDSSKPTTAQPTVTCGAKTWNANIDQNEVGGKAVCDGLYKLDKDCDVVVEDDKGVFKKASLDLATKTFVPTAVDANPYWDAGQVLSTPTAVGYRTAREGQPNSRQIFTVLDTDGDGQYTSGDALVDFTTANVAQLRPYMALTDADCRKIFARLGICGPSGSGLPACPAVLAAADWDKCANQVIHWVRGWDVLDEDGDGCAGPGNPNNPAATCPNGEERDRTADSRAATERAFWKLGDIFHSSPVIVEPPVDEFTCDLGLDNQCVATIHSPQALTATPQTPAGWDVDGNGAVDPGEDAYQAYRNANLGRRQIVLVGANDGMLHAFDAGVPDATVPVSYFGYTYTPGTGEELWAFIPPDLLPKLKDGLVGLTHQYFVDGDTMVRDVWYDDNANGKKEPSEFRTMAVLTERSGGIAYIGLDITNPLSPRFRWIFPNLCTLESALVGQSWSGFAPRPPPIGPVRLKPRAGTDPLGRGFEERWVVAVNGGYDASLTRGRGVWLLDAWTGDVLWRFTNENLVSDVNNLAGMWPVPGAAALVDLGVTGNAQADFDGFFDTLVWADIGGQLYVGRLDPEGDVDASTKRVKNWWAARAFEEQRQTDDSQPIAGRSEFYFMPANAVDPATRYLHSYLGSGNRERILQEGPGCGPDNVMGCCKGGCNTDITTTYDFGGCQTDTKMHCNNGKMKQDQLSTTGTCQTFACGGVNARVFALMNCGGGGKPFQLDARLVCDAAGNCSTRQHIGKGKDYNPAKLSYTPLKNRYYGIWSWGGERVFTSKGTAQTFDSRRFTDIPYAGTCLGTTAGSCSVLETTQASVNGFGGVSCGGGVTRCSTNGYDPGWFYEYGTVCPLASCSPPPPWWDEKTGSAGTVIGGCANWNTFRSQGAARTPVPCTSSAGTPVNYNYVADYLTGVPTTRCGYQATNAYARAGYREAVAPPLAPTQLIGIAGNKVQQAGAQPGDPGTGSPPAKAMGSSHSLTQPVYWLEVPRDLHQCRHADPTQCK